MKRLFRRAGWLPAILLSAFLPFAAPAQEMAKPNAQMQAVLDKLAALGAKPLGTISVAEARLQPSPADAVKALMKERGIMPDPATAAISTRDVSIAGAAGDLPARIYTPPGSGPFPVILYFHGGGWVIAGIETYDASARALAAGTGAIVVSAHYRQAPENKFPAAHDDAIAAYVWTVENIHRHNGDSRHLAVAGESAGANLAMNVALAARDRKLTEPDHLLLVYPVAGKDMNTPSYRENADAKPLSKPAMEWFVKQALADPAQAADPRIDLVGRTDFAGLPPTTIVTAQIDPLRSEGQMLGDRLKAAGVPVEARTYDGVTHEFFGMGPVVDEAKQAMTFATSRLKASLATGTQ